MEQGGAKFKNANGKLAVGGFPRCAVPFNVSLDSRLS